MIVLTNGNIIVIKHKLYSFASQTQMVSSQITIPSHLNEDCESHQTFYIARYKYTIFN